MSDVELRPMSVEEYDAWVPVAIASYAADHARVGSKPADEALSSAKKEFAELLPEGAETPEHHLLVASAAGPRVGILWLRIPTKEPVRAFVYDIEVDEAVRGRGYGRAIMLAAETYAREHGATSIRLHVFGDNTVARRLYESLGYETTNVNMAKTLS